jgi:ribosomal protein S18 acetylase RimI-like enzyme
VPLPGTIKVRSAGTDDAALLGRLNAAVHQVHHDALPLLFKSPNADAATALFAGQLTRPEFVIFIADKDGQALGYAMAEEIRRPETALTFAQSALYLHHLAVVSAARRQGVGRLLVTTVQDEARRRTVDEVRLDYWSFNSSAKRFFSALGYMPYNERARRPVTTEDGSRDTQAGLLQ